jgi:hypothetical protein
MFGNWLNGIDRDTKARIRVGTCAIVWSLWNCRNDITFNKKGTAQFLQVIRMTTHWIHESAFLLPEEHRVHMDSGCTRLETVARDIFNQIEWRLTRRIQDAYVTFFSTG